MSSKEFVSGIPLLDLTLVKPNDPYVQWVSHELGLDLVIFKDAIFANTPDGRIEVTPTFINGIPSIYYLREGGEDKIKQIATHVPHLDPDLITHGGFHSKLWGGTEFRNPSSSRR